MEPEVRYCTSADGIRIGYTVTGEGPPLLMFPLTLTSFSLMHEMPWYDQFVQRVSRGRTLIRYDYRGTGFSQRDVPDDLQLVLSNDPEDVLNALGIGRASVLAGGPVGTDALWFAATHPDRVAAFVIAGTFVRSASLTYSRDAVTSLRDLARVNWEAAARTMAGFNLRRTPQEATKLASIYVRSSSGEVAARHMEENTNVDLTGCLPNITARTLVIHSEDDALYPFAGAQEMAATIPNARLRRWKAITA